MICEICKKATWSATSYRKCNIRYDTVCWDCHDKLEAERIGKMCDTITEAADFKGQSKSDLSECFWTHLGIYQKHPNKKSFNLLKRAWLWAVHDDHGLANSFHHALEWVGIDIWHMPEGIDEE
jgi:hypothetical protein